MYDNIGEKIKRLSKIFFIIGAIISIIIGTTIMATFNSLEISIIAIFIIAIGSLLAWVSFCLLYGFGELIEKVGGIELNTRGGGSSVVCVGKEENPQFPKKQYICPACGCAVNFGDSECFCCKVSFEWNNQ